MTFLRKRFIPACAMKSEKNEVISQGACHIETPLAHSDAE